MRLASNCSSTIPVGPWRCLPMMTSATPVHLVHQVLPFLMLGGVGAGLLAGEVIFLAVDEEHHVGILLDGAGLSEVGQLRALVVAVFDLARKLREGDDGNASSLASALRPTVISETSCTRPSAALRAEPPRSCR